ncbi:MAG: hypothetical protein B6U73_01830 [Desulfurococcales archaeon ex4484_204]|nr:MAG: hypothetical protein B6U73_01830 [Desulfurococcales archaeon ex4484_204]
MVILSAKRFIPISESTLSVAAKLAERAGIPLREFIESVLAEVLKAMQFRSNIIEVISLSDMLDDLRRAGGVILPQSFVYRLVESLDEEVFAELLSEVRRTASWYGTLAKVKRGPDLETLRLVLNVWFPDMNVSIVKGGNSYRVIAASSNQPVRVTNLARAALEELCKALDLEVKDIQVSRGIIKVSVRCSTHGE